MTKPTVLSLFTGGMGLDLGFEERGFEVKVALDNDPAVKDTIHANGRSFPVVTSNVSDVATSDLLKLAGLEAGEPTVVTGAPPCEPFSTAGARNGFLDHRADAVHSFIEIVGEIQPEYFVFEEVPGFIRAAKRHISFYERARMRDDEIEPDVRLGSAFDEVMEDFAALGYDLSFDSQRPKASLLNAADYGAPQKRVRFVLIGARQGPAVTLPKPTHTAPNSKEVHESPREPFQERFEYFDELSKPGVYGSISKDPEARDEVFDWMWDGKFRAWPDVRSVPKILADKVARAQANDPDQDAVKRAIATVIAHDPARNKDKTAANDRIRQFAIWLDSFKREEYKDLDAEALVSLLFILRDVVKITEALASGDETLEQETAPVLTV